MSVLFQVRSTQLFPYYANIGTTPGVLCDNNADTTLPSVVASGISGLFGGSYIDYHITASAKKGLVYPGLTNTFPYGAMTILIRIVPQWTGNPSTRQPLYTWGRTSAGDGGGMCTIETDGKFSFRRTSQSGSNIIPFDVSATGFTANVPTDIVVTWDGTTSANGAKIYQDGALLAQFTVTFGNTTWDANVGVVPEIFVGAAPSAFGPNWFLNEFVMANSVLSISYPRSAFITASNFNGISSSDPGVANVLNAVGYTINGVALTGTSVTTDPGVGNVKNAVAYTINSVAKLGTLVSTDPGQSNVKSGTSYTIESVAKTGSLVSTDPGIANVLRGTDYIIENVSLEGTLTSTDPGEGNVTLDVEYEINSVPKVGVRNIVSNTLAAATLMSGPVHSALSYLTITQGDTAVFNLYAVNGFGNPVNLTGATFTTQIKGPNGVVASFPNDQHMIVDAANGYFQLTLSSDDTASCGLGADKAIITLVDQEESSIYYRADGILTVLFAEPNQ